MNIGRSGGWGFLWTDGSHNRFGRSIQAMKTRRRGLKCSARAKRRVRELELVGGSFHAVVFFR